MLAARGGRVGVAAVGADEAVDHELQCARRLVPVHGRQQDHAVSRRPALVDLAHPVVHLVQRMVGVARARPMAQRHRRRHARLAREDAAAVVRCEQAQVEQVGLDRRLLERVAGDACEAKGLRHLARAGAVVARRAAHHQHARPRRRVLLAGRRLAQAVAGGEPLVGQLVVGVGELRPGLARARRLALLRIRLPGDHLDAPDGVLLRLEGGVVEGAPEALAERLARKHRGCLALAHRGLASVHGKPPASDVPRPSFILPSDG